MEFAITPYQVVVPLVSFFFIFYAWSQVLRGSRTIWGALLWTVFWGSIVVFVLFPQYISYLTAWTGIKDRENAVFAIAIGILLFIVFHILISIEHINKRITDLSRHEALEDAGLSGKKVGSSKKEVVSGKK
jgi:hypothetical protein